MAGENQCSDFEILQVSPAQCLMLDWDILFIYYPYPPDAYSHLWVWKPSSTFLSQPLNDCLLTFYCTSFISLTVWTQASCLTSPSISAPIQSIKIIIVPTPFNLVKIKQCDTCKVLALAYAQSVQYMHVCICVHKYAVCLPKIEIILTPSVPRELTKITYFQSG